jgi:site-specific DNA-methyltransferase (cytosine-N4-specific)
VLARLPAASVHCVVTSPPYLGQRAYGGGDGQIGTESSLRAHLDALCAVFDGLARVLRPDGTVWLNLADKYSGRGNAGASAHRSGRRDRAAVMPSRVRTTDVAPRGSLLHLPARVGIALGERGWLTRNTITWHKPNAMPHRTRGRLQHQTETVLVLARTTRATVDLDALPETGDVWTIPTTPGDGEHPAAMPVELARRAIVAGCPPGGVVCDPFAGSGTSGAAALEAGRRFVGVELHPPYAASAARRLGITPAAGASSTA